MDRVSKLVALAVLATAGTVHAGYAQLAPPAGFSGTPGAWKFAPSANQAVFGNVLHHPGALRVPVPGSSVTMPAAYRLAANAPRIAAGVIFAHPYIRTGVAIASWLGVGKFFWDESVKQWKKTTDKEELIEAFEYSKSGNNVWFPSANAACVAWVSSINGNGGFYTSGGSASGLTCNFSISVNQIDWFQDSTPLDKRSVPCPAGWTSTPAGCLLKSSEVKTVTQPEFEDGLAPLPMPERVPFELPPNSPLPIDPPVINPEPGPDPQPRPLFVPTGDPVPNPQYDPNAPPGPNNLPWNQPGVRVAPSPTPTEPWRVDLQPVNRPVSGPEPMTQPDSKTPPDGDKPSQEQLDFCVKNPDVLACQKLDEPEAQELPESEKDISISPDGGWGADNAACPAPKLITVQGRAIPIPFDLFCTWASGMRPIIIAMAWLSAAFILLGARNES